jgi:DegV family protein with EDD domain
MANIAIVTDTSSDLTLEQAAASDVRLVPLTVTFGDETFEAVTELSNEDFYAKLTAPGAPLPRTAAPNPAQFEAAYRDAFDNGAEGVVCVTLSEKLSATYSSAVQAAAAFEAGQVEVLDSLVTTLSQGMIVRRAAELAQSGASRGEVVDLVQDLIGRTELIFAPETLEYLQKGGRIGRASALVGTMLAIKPILTVVDGEVTSLDRKRTSAKARARMLELAGAQDVESALVLHTAADGVEGFRDAVAAATGLPADSIEIGLTGPVAGTHVGPGMVGISRINTG